MSDVLDRPKRGSAATKAAMPKVIPVSKRISAKAPEPKIPENRKDAALEAVLLSLGINPGNERVTISAPAFQTAQITIRGVTPLVLCRFSEKSIHIMQTSQEAGSQATKGKKREARDFQAGYEGARHKSIAGWDGIPASAFRNALISACRVVGFKMTLAKLSLFTVADGYENDGTPLVRITKGEPRMDIRPARNANGGTDLRARPMWAEGWEARPTFKWDSDQFSATDLVNLLARVGLQVGVGEGRPDSRMSAGVGWGQFELVG